MRLLLLLPLLVALLAFAGCADRESWRQKMVVMIETPDGIVTGENVVEIRFGANRHLAAMDGSSVSWRPRGEAVVVNSW